MGEGIGDGFAVSASVGGESAAAFAVLGDHHTGVSSFFEEVDECGTGGEVAGVIGNFRVGSAAPVVFFAEGKHDSVRVGVAISGGAAKWFNAE